MYREGAEGQALRAIAIEQSSENALATAESIAARSGLAMMVVRHCLCALSDLMTVERVRLQSRYIAFRLTGQGWELLVIALPAARAQRSSTHNVRVRYIPQIGRRENIDYWPSAAFQRWGQR